MFQKKPFQKIVCLFLIFLFSFTELGYGRNLSLIQSNLVAKNSEELTPSLKDEIKKRVFEDGLIPGVIISKEGEIFEVRYLEGSEIEVDWDMKGNDYSHLKRIELIHTGELIGYIDFKVMGEETFLSVAHYSDSSSDLAIKVDDLYREKFRGIGLSLMSMALAVAKGEGAESFRIGSPREEAIPFFEKIINHMAGPTATPFSFSLNNEFPPVEIQNVIPSHIISDDGEIFEIRYLGPEEIYKGINHPGRAESHRRFEIYHKGDLIAFFDFHVSERGLLSGGHAAHRALAITGRHEPAIWVHDDYRKRYRGIGTSLMSMSFRVAKKGGTKGFYASKTVGSAEFFWKIGMQPQPGDFESENFQILFDAMDDFPPIEITSKEDFDSPETEGFDFISEPEGQFLLQLVLGIHEDLDILMDWGGRSSRAILEFLEMNREDTERMATKRREWVDYRVDRDLPVDGISFSFPFIFLEDIHHRLAAYDLRVRRKIEMEDLDYYYHPSFKMLTLLAEGLLDYIDSETDKVKASRLVDAVLDKVDTIILPKLREQGLEIAFVLPEAKFWLAYVLMPEYSGPLATELFLSRARALAAYSAELSALFLNYQGMHLRENNRFYYGDNRDKKWSGSEGGRKSADFADLELIAIFLKPVLSEYQRLVEQGQEEKAYFYAQSVFNSLYFIPQFKKKGRVRFSKTDYPKALNTILDLVFKEGVKYPRRILKEMYEKFPKKLNNRNPLFHFFNATYGTTEVLSLVQNFSERKRKEAESPVRAITILDLVTESTKVVKQYRQDNNHWGSRPKKLDFWWIHRKILKEIGKEDPVLDTPEEVLLKSA